MVMAGHQSQKFVCYPICRETAARGHSLVNWIAELTVPERGFGRREDWNRRGDPAVFLPRFESLDFCWLRAPDRIRSAQAVYEFPMAARDPLDSRNIGYTAGGEKVWQDIEISGDAE